ncbi:MAG TPA: hypothetical protein VEB68_08710 [Croceibacterium sp.]|nr:hypothetical protein [Croceibacterium sp.]
MTGKDLTRLAVGLLVGGAIAFPAGLWLGGSDDPQAPRDRPPAEMRRVFSPDVRGDPYVLAQLKQQVEALEAHCRATGEMCAEARGARSRYAELAARP